MKLKKELGYMDVFSISTGAMISSGIFILPGIAFSKAGPIIILGYIFGGLVAFIGILSVVELTTAMPKAGGDYFFITRSLGPLIGTISGILSWFAICLKSSFAIFGIAGVIGEIIYSKNLTTHNIIIISIIVTLIFLILNMIGVEIASTFEIILVISLIIILSLFFIIGIFHVHMEFFSPFIQIYKLVDNKFQFAMTKNLFSSFGALTTASIAGFVFVSFGGLLKIASISEEIKKPKKNVPKGMILSIIVTVILYTLILFVVVGVLPGEQLSNSLTPISDAAFVFGGKPGYIILTIASLLAFISTANAGIMAASRYPLALSRDRLFPEFVSLVNKKFKTPIIAIILTGVFIIGALFLSLESLAKAASAVILMTYILTNLSLIIIKESNLSNYKPSFSAPLYPWIQIFTILMFSFFIFNFGTIIIESSVMLILISLIVYFLYGRKNIIKEYALMHLLIRITKNLKSNHNLENELRDIIHQRDDVELTEFDKIVMDAPIIELEESTTLKELIKIEADNFAKILNRDPLKLEKLFLERENDITTAVSGFTAIPHIVLNDIDTFHMAVFRCKEGIKFSEKHANIKAVFLFVSSSKLNKLHLQTLASIASLIREEDFQKRWLAAKNINYLRDLILLRNRK